MKEENTLADAELLNFSAEWCEPCKWAEPILKEVVTNFEGRLHFRKIDIDAHTETAREFHVLSVPTLVLMKNGKEVWRMRGFDTAPNLLRIFRNYIK